MRARDLGRTGIRVSEIGCGTAGFAPALRLGGRLLGHGNQDAAASRATLEEAWGSGVTLFDTSDWFGLGACERALGEALRQWEGEKVVVTKGGLVPDGARHAVSDFSRDHLISACARSLKRLRLAQVDVYLLHEPQPSDVSEGTWKALEEIKAQGWARAVGAAVSDARFGERLVAERRVDVLMVPVNLVNQRATLSLLAAASRAGVGVIARSPFAAGLLSDRRGVRPEFPPDDYRSDRWTDGYVAHAVSIGNLARAIGRGVPLPELALRYGLSQDVAGVVCGFRRPEDVRSAVGAAKAGPLPGDLLRRLKNAG